MITIATIVEGETEEFALPVLLRRMAAELGVYDVDIPRPFRLPRSKFTVSDDIGRAVSFAAAAAESGGCVLAFADSDDECAVEFARKVRTAASRPDVRLHVIAAVREFESLFLATSGSLIAAGKFTGRYDADAEQVRDAAGAVSALMVDGRYKKTAHAAALSAALSLDEARKCRWYRKLESDLRGVFGG